MKQKLRRFMAGFLAILTMFTTLFTNGTTAFAASSSANIAFWVASSKDHGVISEFNSKHTGSILYAMIDGHSAYCMNFGLSAKGGQLMNSDSNPNTNLSAAQEKLLAYCMYYGYSTTEAKAPTNDQRNKFIATQSMVWIIVNGIFGTGSADSAASKLCACAPDSSSSYSYYETLRDKINASYNATRPSFASKTKSDATTYELKWNESNKRFEYTFTDSNGVLGNFDFSIDGFSVSKSGNSMTVYTKSVNTTATLGSFKSTIGAVDTTSSCVFWLTGNSGDQEFVSEQPSADPISAYIKVKTENIGYGEITKTDESSGVKLAGAVYGIYSDSGCTNLVGKMTTDSNGYAKSKALVAGTYYVKEITAPKGYVLSGKVHTLTVKAGQTTGIKATNKEQLGSITIYKEGEVLVGWNGSNFTYETRKLPGATFKVTAGADIYKADGTKVYNKGDVIAENLVSGSDGQAVLSDLHLGTYVVTETKSIDGYTINTTPQTVKIEYKDQNVMVQAESTTIKNSRQKAEVSVVKKDSDTDNPLTGGQYTLYAGNDIKNYDGRVIVTKGAALQTVTTGADGKATYTVDLPISNSFYIAETKAPVNYVRNSDDVYLKSSLKVKADGTYDYESATPVVIGENGAKSIYTDEKGHAVSIAIPYGTYVVLETETPHNMETIKPFEVKIVENNPTKPQTWRVFIDREFTAKLRVVKKDADTKQTVLIPNTEFKIFNLDTEKYVSMITTYPSKVTHTSFFTDEDGDLILPEALKLGNYRIEEIAAPFGYVVNETYVKVAVDTDTAYEIDPETYEAIITVDYEDAPVVGELTVEKKGEVLDSYKGGLFADSDEKSFVYREGSLAGAKYEVYAAEDIFTADMQKDADGNRTKYYSEGELVATLVTGDDGKAVIKNLPLGKYKVVEVEAPYGYVLNQYAQYVTFAYVDDHTPVIYETAAFTNDRQKLSLSVEKKDSETDELISGAVFGLYADEDIRNVDGKVIIEAGTLLETAVSDENGIVSFTKDYPFAKYFAKEMETPAGYVTNEEVIAFDAQYQGQDIKVAKYSSLFLNTTTTFEFSKEDITSGAELSGATLCVIDKDGNVIETWTSVSGEKHVIKKLVVGETYTLREEFAPYGYLRATDIQFTVEDTENIQSVVMKDEVPTGSIIINKDGEFVTDKTLIKGHWYDFIFNYFKKSLAGVTFEVYAAEDIVSPDGLDTVYFEKDELVATIVTDDNGIASIEELPLGKYYLVETETIEGFVLDSTPIEADLSYVDQDTEVVYAGMDVTNERQKVKITVVKTDSETEKPLEGAVFGLFAKEDIVNSEGTVIVAADERIEKAVTGADGTVTFVSDLPLGQYYVKEIEAPKGYVNSDEVFDVDASYQGEDVTVIEFTAEFENAPIKVEFSKTDITGEKEIAGAKLSVIDSEGKVVESWTSEAGKNHMIERLPVGKYTLREETAPYGYKIAKDVEFEVTETAEIQEVSMKDEYAVGKIIIEKTDEVTKKPIAGVEFEIRDKDGKVIETVVTDKDGHAESKELPICIYNEDGSFKEDIHYYVVETKAAEGYILDETVHDVVLQYDDNAPECVEYTLSLTNKPTEPKLPQTGDNFNPWLYAGLGLGALALGLFAAFWKKKEDGAEEA